MSIRFCCPHCNKPFGAPDRFAGATAKCKSCHKRLRIPKQQSSLYDYVPHGPHVAVGASDGRDSKDIAFSGCSWNERKIMGTVVGAAVACLLIFTTVLLVSKHSQDKERAKTLATLTDSLHQAMAQATQLSADYQFDLALASFDEVALSIRDSSAATFALQEQLDDAVVAIRRAKNDHESKVAAGWRVFEGRFVSPDEEKLILESRAQKEADRLADQRRAEKERRQKRAAAQKEDAARQRRERKAQRKAENELYASAVNVNADPKLFNYCNDSIALAKMKRNRYRALFQGDVTHDNVSARGQMVILEVSWIEDEGAYVRVGFDVLAVADSDRTEFGTTGAFVLSLSLEDAEVLRKRLTVNGWGIEVVFEIADYTFRPMGQFGLVMLNVSHFRLVAP